MMLHLLIFFEKQKNVKLFFYSHFTTRGAPDPKVMGTIESGSLRYLFLHLAKSNWTYGSRDIKCWEKSGGGGGAAAVGVQLDYLGY